MYTVRVLCAPVCLVTNRPLKHISSVTQFDFFPQPAPRAQLLGRHFTSNNRKFVTTPFDSTDSTVLPGSIQWLDGLHVIRDLNMRWSQSYKPTMSLPSKLGLNREVFGYRDHAYSFSSNGARNDSRFYSRP